MISACRVDCDLSIQVILHAFKVNLPLELGVNCLWHHPGWWYPCNLSVGLLFWNPCRNNKESVLREYMMLPSLSMGKMNTELKGMCLLTCVAKNSDFWPEQLGAVLLFWLQHCLHQYICMQGLWRIHRISLFNWIHSLFGIRTLQAPSCKQVQCWMQCLWYTEKGAMHLNQPTVKGH